MKKLKSLSSVVNDIKYELFTYGDAAEATLIILRSLKYH